MEGFVTSEQNDMNPIYVLNRSWNIRKSFFLPSCPHQVCEYFVAGYRSSVCDLADNAIETP